MAASNNADVFSTWVSDLGERDVCVVYMCGELDASSAPRFLSDIKHVVVGRRNVIMDVHLLEYADSTGVSAILSTKNAIERAGYAMCLVGCHGLLTRILETIQVYDRFTRFDDVDSAIRQTACWCKAPGDCSVFREYGTPQP